VRDLAVPNYDDDNVTVLSSQLGQTATATSTGISPLGTGTHQVDASYPGNISYSASTSATAGLTAQQGTPTVAVVASASSITTAQQLSVTITVSYQIDDPNPSGTVLLTNGTFTSTATSLSGGAATIAIPAGSLAAGADTLTASYSGDTDYKAATGTAAVTVIPPTFAITGTAVSVAPGATTANTSTISVTPAGGFTGSVALTAALTSSPTGAVDAPTFSFGATTLVSITGSATGTATLTIATTASTSGTCTAANQMPDEFPRNAGGLLLACVFLFGIPRLRRRWRSMLGMALLLAACVSGVLSCGGSGGGTKCAGPVTPGTTAGTNTITVTGTSGALTETGLVTLTVQ
jgi:hypothetical protein